jgi:hypothetical protein
MRPLSYNYALPPVRFDLGMLWFKSPASSSIKRATKAEDDLACQLIARLVDAVEEQARRAGATEAELRRLHSIRVAALRGLEQPR